MVGKSPNTGEVESISVAEMLGVSSEDIRKAGGYLLIAMQEVAEEVGGTEFVAEVNVAANFDEAIGFPSPFAFNLFENRYPGISTYVMERSQDIQTATQKRSS